MRWAIVYHPPKKRGHKLGIGESEVDPRSGTAPGDRQPSASQEGAGRDFFPLEMVHARGFGSLFPHFSGRQAAPAQPTAKAPAIVISKLLTRLRHRLRFAKASPVSGVEYHLCRALHNTLSEVNFPAPGGCTQLGQAGAVLESTTRMI